MPNTAALSVLKSIPRNNVAFQNAKGNSKYYFTPATLFGRAYYENLDVCYSPVTSSVP
jgi:hypothetical protein